MFHLLLLLASASRQVGGDWSTVHYSGGGTEVANYGTDLDWIGDLNGDGCDDFIVGAPRHDVGSTSGIEMGAVFVISGQSGQVLYSLTAAATPGYRLGTRVSRAGDLDLDGVPDFAYHMWASTGGVQSAIKVISGATLQEITQYDPPGYPFSGHFGLDGIRGGSDLNQDGVPEMIVSDSIAHNGVESHGAVWVIDGATGFLDWYVEGAYSGQQYGFGIGSPGDLNGDGIGDVLAASYPAQGSVHVLSGLDGSEFYALWDPYLGALLGLGGQRLDGCGDVDGDGLGDYLASSAQSPYSSVKGYATIHRGSDGAIIHRWEGFIWGDNWGSACAFVGDVDDDGSGDFLVGAYDFSRSGPAFTGHADLFSGRDWAHLHSESGLPEPEGGIFGGSIARGSGDANGDGRADVLVADSGEDFGGLRGAGAVYVFSFDPFLEPNTREIAAAAGGVLTFNLDFPATESGLNYRLLASDDLPGSLTVRGVQIPLVWTALLQKFVNSPPPVFDHPTGTLDANGDALVTAAIPANALAAYVGRTVKFAAVSLITPSQPSLSSAAAWIEVLP